MSNNKHSGYRRTLPAAVIAAALLICVTFAGCGASLKNPSFEKGSGILINDWQVNNYERSAGDDSAETATVVDGGYSGKAVKINNNVPNDVRIYQKLKVAKNSYYLVSCMVKIEGVIDENVSDESRGAGFNISAIKASQRSAGLYTTGGEWQEYSAYVRTGPEQKEVELSIGVGGYSAESSGVAYVDNVSIKKVNSLPEGHTAVSVEIKSDGDGKKGTETSVWFKLLFVALAAALTVFVILVIKKHDEEAYALKRPLSQQPVKLKRLEKLKRQGLLKN